MIDFIIYGVLTSLVGTSMVVGAVYVGVAYFANGRRLP